MPKQQPKNRKASLSSFEPVIQQAARLRNARSNETETRPDPYRPSAINLRQSDWYLLQDVARVRARKVGKGRASVSALIEQLIRDNRTALEREREA